MKIKLDEIAEIMTGHTYRGTVIHDSSGDTTLVQSKDISINGDVNSLELPKVTLGETRSKAYLEDGDVLLSSRGSFRAGTWEAKNLNALATSTIYVIRLKNKKVSPRFLTLFLNSEQGQQEINKHVRGATIPALPITGARQIEISLVSSKMQKTAVEVEETWKELKRRYDRRQELYSNIATSTLNHILTNKNG